MRTVRVVVAFLMVLAGGLVATGTASAGASTTSPTPSVKVFPSRGLSGGDTVLVAGSGLPPRTDIAVIQCEFLQTNRPDRGCSPRKTVTSDRWGRLLTRLLLADPVRYSGPFGAGYPMYCRADHCRVILAWGDPELGEQESVESRELSFKGAPATIAVTPSTDLRRKQWVTVTGTAYGAEGRRVGVRQHLCYDLVQETGCFGDLGYVWTKVKRDGTFRTAYLARRFVPTGFLGGRYADCAEDPSERFADCSMTAVILDRQGEPDDSFGDAEFFGDPEARLEFATG